MVRIIQTCRRLRLVPPRRARAVGLLVALAMVALSAGCATLKHESARTPPKSAPYTPAVSEALFGNYLAGRFAGSLRDTKRAVRFYDRALAEDPGNTAILDHAFLLEVSSGDIEAAVSRAQRVVASNPDMHLAALVLALHDTKRGNYGSARAQLSQSGNALFSVLVSRFVSAWIFEAQGQTDNALAELNYISSIAAFDLFRLSHKALVLDHAGRTERAATAYRAALDAGGDGAIRVVDAYGRFLERTGRTEVARALYKNFLEQSPDNPMITTALARLEKGERPEPLIATPDQGIAEALYDIASALAQDRSVELPIVYLQLTIYMRPDFDVAQALLADLFQLIGRPADANALLARIDRDSPLAKHAAIETAMNLDRMGETDSAIAQLRAIAGRDENDLRTLVSLGDVLRTHDRFAEAVDAYSRAIALVDASDNRYWSLFYTRGVALDRAGNWPKAERDFQHALDLDPNQPIVLNYLGYSWVDRGEKLKEALAMIERAVELMPDDGYIVDSLGWAHYRIGNYELAATYLERAVSLRPEDPTINDHLGDAFWRVGRELEARFQWRHALALRPDEEVVPLIEHKLDFGLDDATSQRTPAAAKAAPDPAPMP